MIKSLIDIISMYRSRIKSRGFLKEVWNNFQVTLIKVSSHRDTIEIALRDGLSKIGGKVTFFDVL